MHIPKALLLVAATALALNVTSTFAKDSDEAAKLREAMRQKLAEGKTAQTAPAQAAPAAPAKPAAPAATAKPVTPAAPAASAKPTPAPAPTKPAPVSQPAPATQASTTDAVAVGDKPEDAALREAMRARMADNTASTAVPTAAPKEPAPAPTKPAKPAPTKAKPAKAAATPMEAPASPLAGSKEERLKQLLDQYKADQITPEEYHKQRAKIVAE